MAKWTMQSTGDPLDVSNKDQHCSLVMTTDTIKVKVEGKFRQRERKLFVLLIHSVWNNIGIQRVHTLELEKIKHVFKTIAGVKDFNSWLWTYLKNLADIKIEYSNERLHGVTRLFSDVWFDKENKTVSFEIPEKLEQSIKNPTQFARLDTYFLIGLKGKYSVSLYQLLESKINLKKFDPKLTPREEDRMVEIPVGELRDWMSIGDQYKLWGHFKARVLLPSVEEINSNPIESTFTVKVSEVKGARNKVVAVKFYLVKTEARLALEKKILVSQKSKDCSEKSFIIRPFKGTVVYERAKQLIPAGVDVYDLEREWREYSKKKDEPVSNPEGAFLSWLKNRATRNMFRT